MSVICTLAPTILCLKLRMHLHHSTVFIYDLCYALIHFTNPATLFYFPGIYTNVLITCTFLYFNFDSCFHLNHFLAACFRVSVAISEYKEVGKREKEVNFKGYCYHHMFVVKRVATYPISRQSF